MELITELDVQIGAHIKLLRLERKLSRQKLAQVLGVSFQQIQKYEQGVNRVSAGRLYKITEFFNVPITFFFPCANPFDSFRKPAPSRQFTSLEMREAQAPFSYDNETDYGQDNQKKDAEEALIFERANMNYAETRALLAAYFSIEDKEMREPLLLLIENLSAVKSKK